MMYAKKIRMQNGCYNSNNLEEIESIYIDGCTNPGFFTKGTLHDYLKKHPDTICVNIFPYPHVIPATSAKGEKYVRSSPNDWVKDNLLNLPREQGGKTMAKHSGGKIGAAGKTLASKSSSKSAKSKAGKTLVNHKIAKHS